MTSHFLADYEQFERSWQIRSDLPVDFKLKYSTNIFAVKNKDLLNVSQGFETAVIVIDKVVNEIYKNNLIEYLETNKVKLEILAIDSGENKKNWDTVDKILDFFEKINLYRKQPVISIGGGVLLDIVGFACSIYRRGVPYVKVPTTLLAIVDASVGSKTGVNHFKRRNRIGSYYPPILTLIDKNFICTENRRNIINGLGEIFKLAVIKSQALFDLLETNSKLLLNEKFRYGAVPVRVINLAITEMIAELAPNLWEKKLDRCVDFGHTFSPVIEMNNTKSLLHGEAVALDCIFSSIISYKRNYINEQKLKRIINLAKDLELPIYEESFNSIELLTESLDDATKHRNGNQFAPLPIDIGNYTIVNDIDNDELIIALKMFKGLSK